MIACVPFHLMHIACFKHLYYKYLMLINEGDMAGTKLSHFEIGQSI